MQGQKDRKRNEPNGKNEENIRRAKELGTCIIDLAQGRLSLQKCSGFAI